MYNILRHIDQKVWLSLIALFAIPVSVYLVSQNQIGALPQAKVPLVRPTPVCARFDLNCDGQVCRSDSQLIQDHFGQTVNNCFVDPQPICRYDLNRDRIISGKDLSIFLSQAQLDNCP